MHYTNALASAAEMQISEQAGNNITADFEYSSEFKEVITIITIVSKCQVRSWAICHCCNHLIKHIISVIS